MPPPRRTGRPAWAPGCARGTATRSASVPWCSSESSERLGSSVSSPRQSGRRDHGVDDHLVAVLVDAGGVAAEDHRQPVLRQPDPAQRPDVVMVERGGADVDHRPAVTRLGLRAVADLECGQRVVGVRAGGVGGEHGAGPYICAARYAGPDGTPTPPGQGRGGRRRGAPPAAADGLRDARLGAQGPADHGDVRVRRAPRAVLRRALDVPALRAQLRLQPDPRRAVRGHPPAAAALSRAAGRASESPCSSSPSSSR